VSKLGTAKARHALAVRYYGVNSPQARDTKARLDAERTAVYIARLLAAAPPLSTQQLNDLSELLRPIRGKIPADTAAQPVKKKQKPRARRDRGAA
jgi:hypothetical protein